VFLIYRKCWIYLEDAETIEIEDVRYKLSLEGYVKSVEITMKGSDVFSSI